MAVWHYVAASGSMSPILNPKSEGWNPNLAEPEPKSFATNNTEFI
jgi:hypothetical protein